MVGTKTNGWETKTKKTKTSKMYFSAAQSIFTQLQSRENWQSCIQLVWHCMCVDSIAAPLFTNSETAAATPLGLMRNFQ